MDYLTTFQAMIDEYNAGSVNVEEFFRRLIDFAQDLTVEERRGISEGLSDEELALFDLLTKPDVALSAQEEQQVKKVARALLATLKREKLVVEWRKKQRARAAVQLCIAEHLDGLPQAPYPEALYERKCELAYQHVFEAYYGNGGSIYTGA